MFSRKQKQRIVREMRVQMRSFYRGHHPEAACLYWAACASSYLSRKYRVRTILQAGTMQWPCSATDDGVSPTHFSYMWEPDSLMTKSMFEAGLMPEMHVWAAIPSENEIVDLTTRYLVQQAKKRAALAWTAPPPPDFLWARADQLPSGVVYRPDFAATMLATQLLAASAR